MMKLENPQKFSFNIEEALPAPEVINIPNRETPVEQKNQSLVPQNDVIKVKKFCRIIRWASLPLALVQLLVLLPKAYPLLVTCAFPLIGFIGAKRYNTFTIQLFAAYLISLVFVQIIAMIAFKGALYIALQSTFMIFELSISIVAIKAQSIINRLSFDDLKALHT